MEKPDALSSQAEWREYVEANGLNLTPKLDEDLTYEQAIVAAIIDSDVPPTAGARYFEQKTGMSKRTFWRYHDSLE